MLTSRRNRSPLERALRTLRSHFTDARLIGCYVAPFGLGVSDAVDSWADCRGTGIGGPTLTATLTARPAFNTATGRVVFNGTSHFLRASTGLSLAAPCALAYVGKFAPSNAAAKVVAMLSDAGTNNTLGLDSTTIARGVTQAVAANYGSHPGAGVVVGHARRAQVGGTATAGVAIGSAAEVTAAGADATTTATRLTLGASRADVAASFGAIEAQALLVISGTYTAADVAVVNTFGTVLGATV